MGLTPMTPMNPWNYAKEDNRSYITPEDINKAITAGATRQRLRRVVLHAIANRKCEDVNCCAFVALECKKKA